MILLSTDRPVLLLVVVEVSAVDIEAEKLSLLRLVDEGRSLIPICCFSSTICFRSLSLTFLSVTGPFLVVRLSGTAEDAELSNDSDPTKEGAAGSPRSCPGEQRSLDGSRSRTGIDGGDRTGAGRAWNDFGPDGDLAVEVAR